MSGSNVLYNPNTRSEIPLNAESTMISAMVPMQTPATEIKVMMLIALCDFLLIKYLFAMNKDKFMAGYQLTNRLQMLLICGVFICYIRYRFVNSYGGKLFPCFDNEPSPGFVACVCVKIIQNKRNRIGNHIVERKNNKK